MANVASILIVEDSKLKWTHRIITGKRSRILPSLEPESSGLKGG
jgi:hypothetical protein